MIETIAFIISSFTLQLLIAELMFCWFFPRRSYFLVRLLGCCVPFILLTYDMPFVLVGSVNVRFILTLIISLIIMFFCFKASFRTILFCCISGYAVRGMGMNLFVLTEYWRGTLVDEKYDLLFYLSFVVVYVVCYFVFARRLMNHKLLIATNKRVELVALATILVDQLCGIWQWRLNLPLNPVCPLYGILSCTLILCLQYLIHMEDLLRQKNSLLEQSLKKEQVRFEQAQAAVEQQQARQKDLLCTAQSLRSTDESALASRLEELAKRQALPETGNQAINIALAEKLELCKSEQINFTFMVDGEALAFMPKEDLYAMLSMVLTNACSCELAVADPTQRFIALKIFSVAGCAYLHLDNYQESADSKNIADRLDDGMPVEQGLDDLCYLTEKYGGIIKFDQKENRFCVDILFPEKNKAV